MNLFFIHCGFYDDDISHGIYEFHINIPVAAETVEQAKKTVRQDPLFIDKKMHIDGIQEVKQVSGYAVHLLPVSEKIDSEIQYFPYRDL